MTGALFAAALTLEKSVPEDEMFNIRGPAMAFSKRIPPRAQLQAADVYLIEEVKQPQAICSAENAKARKAPDLVEIWNSCCTGTVVAKSS